MVWEKGKELNHGKFIVVGEEPLGSGGFGITYKVARTRDRKLFVIKTLNTIAQNRSNFRQIKDDFLNEAHTLASFKHPNIVQIYPKGFTEQEDELWCMVMEFIEGQNLEEYLEENKEISEINAIALITKIGEALAYIHQSSYVHRDIKPSNIMLRDYNLLSPVLIDFGLAREFDPNQSLTMDSRLTEHFAPLEQYDLNSLSTHINVDKSKYKVGTWTDVYSLAATLYNLLTREKPMIATFRQLSPQNFKPPQQLNPKISDRTNAAILKGMAIKPGDRSQTISDWLKLLKPSIQTYRNIFNQSNQRNELNRVIHIHEFSTGIKPDRDANGNWISRGFTGRYMNCTLPEIPYNVERAIANQLFAVVEGYSIEQPAIIGRVVPGRDDSKNYLGKLDWSVVAIISLGRDDRGRLLTVYRYFLSKGSLSILCAIVRWIEKFQQYHRRLPVFNPFDQKVVDDYSVCEIDPPAIVQFSDETIEWLNKQTRPILVNNSKKISLTEFYYQAAYISARHRRNQNSWAYNVAALEKPLSFDFISAANETAYQRIKSHLDNISDKYTTLRHSQKYFDSKEIEIRRTIKQLIHKTRSKEESFVLLVNAFKEEEITENEWNKLFNNQGAEEIVKHCTYTPSAIKLLILKTIIIPKKLPDFLDYITNKSYNNSLDEYFKEFESKILEKLKTNQEDFLYLRLLEGLVFTISEILHKSILSSKLEKLLSVSPFWSFYMNKVIDIIELNLQLIDKSNGYRISYDKKRIFETVDLQEMLSAIKVKSDNLSCLIPLFKSFGKHNQKSYKIAAYLSQITQKKVEGKLFFQAFGKLDRYEYCGLIIERSSYLITVKKLNLYIAISLWSFSRKMIKMIYLRLGTLSRSLGRLISHKTILLSLLMILIISLIVLFP